MYLRINLIYMNWLINIQPIYRKFNFSILFRPPLLSPTLSPPTLPRPLTSATTTTGLHLLGRKVAQVTTRHGIAALHMTLLSAEAKLLVLLLALERRAVFVAATAFTTSGFGCVVNGNIKQVVRVIGWAGRVCLALCIALALA